MGYWIVDGRKLTDEEYEELQKQERQDKQRAREEASRLAKQLGEAYAALKQHLQQNPHIDRQITDEQELDQQVYHKLRQNLDRADRAPRCRKIKADGTGCGSPQIRNQIYCFAHLQMEDARAEKLVLPALEDANAIQMAVMLVQRALINDEISEKKAGLLLYSLQIAAANVDKTTFGQAADEELVTEIVEEDELIERHQQAVEKQERLEEIAGRRRFTQMGADQEGKEEQDLPRMNADGADRNGKTSPLITTDDTEQSGEGGRILPRSVGDGRTGEGACATRGAEVHANLG